MEFWPNCTSAAQNKATANIYIDSTNGQIKSYLYLVHAVTSFVPEGKKNTAAREIPFDRIYLQTRYCCWKEKKEKNLKHE